MEKKIVIVNGDENLLKLLLDMGLIETEDDQTTPCVDPDQETLFHETSDKTSAQEPNGSQSENDLAGKHEHEPITTDEPSSKASINLLDEASTILYELEDYFNETVRSRMFIHVMRDMPKTIPHINNGVIMMNKFVKMDYMRRKIHNLLQMSLNQHCEDDDIFQKLYNTLGNRLNEMTLRMGPIMTMLRMKGSLLLQYNDGGYISNLANEDQSIINSILSDLIQNATKMINEAKEDLKSMVKDTTFIEMLSSTENDNVDSAACVCLLNRFLDNEYAFFVSHNLLDQAATLVFDQTSCSALVNAQENMEMLLSLLQPMREVFDNKFEILFDYVESDFELDSIQDLLDYDDDKEDD